MIDVVALAKKYEDKLKKIKVLAFDIDGILTNGKIWWQGEEVGWNRAFQTRDGYGLKLMQQAGFKVGVITGGNSLGIKKRFEENLALDFIFSGTDDKRAGYLKLLKMDDGYTDDQILYMGDEHFDMPLLKKCGFSATAPNATREVIEIVDYVTETAAGMGCAREVMDIMSVVHNIKIDIPDFD